VRNTYNIFVGKLEGKRPLERSRRVWEDNIGMERREKGWNVWTGFIWLRIRTSKGKVVPVLI
jgi:hypothetical protein